MKVGVLALATGEYVKYITPLINSAKVHFLNGHQVTFYVLTDSQDRLKDCVQLATERRSWRDSMLHRYRDLLQHRAKWQNEDFLVSTDADMLICGVVGNEILECQMFFTESPVCKNDRPNEDRPWHRNEQSLGYVSLEQSENETYRTGAFFGGRRDWFIKFLEEGQALMDIDLANNATNPQYNEEVALNHWALEHKDMCKFLDFTYCWPARCYYPERRDGNGKQLRAKIASLDKGQKMEAAKA